ncbi:MAG: pitrilysin family protein [Bacteroidota bacterium]
MVLDRTQAPPFRPVTDYTLPKPEKRHLKNGQPLFIWRTNTQPVVALQASFEAGKRREKTAGVASFTAKMLSQGTSKRDYQAISDFIAQHGAYLDIQANSHFIEIELFCLPRFLESMLELLRELVFDSTFPEERLKQILQLQAQQLQVNRQKNNFVASEEFRRNLYGDDHPSGKIWDIEQIVQLKANTLKTFFTDFIDHRPAEWFLTGVFDEEIPALIDQYFGQHELKPYPETIIPDATPRYEQIYLEKEKSMQTTLRLGRFLVENGHEDYPAIQVMNEIFGGYFGSRLMQNLREEKGLTYGVFSRVQTLRNQSSLWFIGADVKKAQRELARNELFVELQKLQSETVPTEELERVLNYMAGSFVSDFATPFAVTEKYRHLRRLSLPEDYYDHIIPKWRAVTAEQVQTVAKKYGNLPFLEVMVG